MDNASSDWESLAMIVEFYEGRFNSAHGYAYSPGGVISAVASDPWAVASGGCVHGRLLQAR